MANTFLNTGRSMVATSNPQTNVNQVTPNAVPEIQESEGTGGVQNHLPSKQQTNTINPITIPIQIQPQVATQQNSNSVVTQPSEQLKTASSSTQTVQAPTPQTYQNNNGVNSSVNVNQIYGSYQSGVGNANSNFSSGIKKTSMGTTIVTPTTSNLSSVQGQYQSAYSDTMNSIISEMLTQMKNGFQYDPNSDNALKLATEYAANSTLQNLAGSGVLNSSSTSERVARIVSELIPTYEEKAHGRWIEYLGQLSNTAQIVMNYDAQQFEYWKDAKDREFENNKFAYQKQQDSLNNAWKRVDELGYVDNQAASILGVPVGTLSSQARLAKEQREFELSKMREQAEIEYKNNLALYKIKSELDMQQSKVLAENEYILANKYGKSSSNTTSTTNLSTYKDIINNRWAEYDDISKKYVVSDNVGIYNYLVSEYSAGRMSDTDLQNLSAMYGVTQPTDKEIAKAERIKYLNSLGK